MGEAEDRIRRRKVVLPEIVGGRETGNFGGAACVWGKAGAVVDVELSKLESRRAGKRRRRRRRRRGRGGEGGGVEVEVEMERGPLWLVGFNVAAERGECRPSPGVKVKGGWLRVDGPGGVRGEGGEGGEDAAENSQRGLVVELHRGRAGGRRGAGGTASRGVVDGGWLVVGGWWLVVGMGVGVGGLGLRRG